MASKVISIADRMWQTGAFVPRPGMYAVSHSEHRLPTEVTLIQGERFPRCQACSAPAAQFDCCGAWMSGLLSPASAPIFTNCRCSIDMAGPAECRLASET